jgi:colanic acid/amylovoran biosynthesis glycosyltransferase
MRADASSRLTVLMYHRIGDPAEAPPGMVSATPGTFERQMRWLAATGRAVSLADVLATRAGRSRLRPRAVLVTFDDAYADFAAHGWPVLRSYGIPVTLFVPTAFPGDPRAAFWWDRLYAALTAMGEPRDAYRVLRERVKALAHDEGMAFVDEIVTRAGAPPPHGRVLSWDELRVLAAEGVTLAPHTRTHPCLDRLPVDRLADEIGGSLADLRAEIGAAAPAFAYPAGQVSTAAEEAVRAAGLELAFTTASGVAELVDGHWLALPRLSVGRRLSPSLLRAALAAPTAMAKLASAREARRRRLRDPPATGTQRPAVAYVMSRFPKISETFILTEILALDQRGVRVEVYPLLREGAALAHEEAAAVVRRAHYLPFISPAILASQLHWLRHRPRSYLGALREVVAGTAGSLNFFVGGLAIFPKVAHAARLMQADGVAHVHCHFANHPALAGLVINRLTGIPYSFTAHGSDLHVDRRMLPEKVAGAAFVAAISGYNRRLIVDECGGRFADKVRVIRAGVDTTHFTPRRRLGSAGRLRVLCVGTLHEVKGQAHLIDACRLLTDEGLGIECRLVGDGPDRPMLTRRIEAAGLGDRILLVGEKTRTQVAAELVAADVLVAPSVPTKAGKREGIPVVLMEAMSSGLAVVASDLSGIPELVEDGVTGWLVAPGDAAGLAGALRALHADPELRRRLGEAGRRRVLKEFDIEQSVAELVRRFSLEPAA